MNQDYIKQRIAKIRKLISEARHIEAFDDLEAFIVEMDGEEVENARERELLNQLIGIKSRFSLFNKKMLQGMQEDNIELNQITASLLSLTDSIKNIADENPAVFIPSSIEKKQNTYSANMAIDPDASKTPVAINELSKDGSQNSGCLNVLGDDKKSNNLVSLIKAVSPILILSILLIGLFFILRGGDGCGKTPVTPPPTIDTNPPVKKPIEVLPLGKNGEELGFDTDNSMSQMADHLSNPNTKLPKEFNINGASFGNNSARLSSSAKKQLDDLTIVLKEYSNANIDIYGYINGSEKGSYRGNKEIGLDDVRARNVQDYLMSRGISQSRMNFEGNGTGVTNNVRIRITNR